MIQQAHLTAWQAHAPWPRRGQEPRIGNKENELTWEERWRDEASLSRHR